MTQIYVLYSDTSEHLSWIFLLLTESLKATPVSVFSFVKGMFEFLSHRIVLRMK